MVYLNKVFFSLAVLGSIQIFPLLAEKISVELSETKQFEVNIPDDYAPCSEENRACFASNFPSNAACFFAQKEFNTSLVVLEEISSQGRNLEDLLLDYVKKQSSDLEPFFEPSFENGLQTVRVFASLSEEKKEEANNLFFALKGFVFPKTDDDFDVLLINYTSWGEENGRNTAEALFEQASISDRQESVSTSFAQEEDASVIEVKEQDIPVIEVKEQEIIDPPKEEVLPVVVEKENIPVKITPVEKAPVALPQAPVRRNNNNKHKKKKR